MAKKRQHTDASPLFTVENLPQLFASEARPLRLDAILRITGLPRHAKKDIEAALTELTRRGELIRLRGGLWAKADSLKQITGRFTALRTGGGFVTPDREGAQSAPDIYIPIAEVNNALHQDTVRIVLAPRPAAKANRLAHHGASNGKNGHKSPEGRIIKVLERGLKEIPAHCMGLAGGQLICRPADSRLNIECSVELPAGESPPEKGSLVLLALKEQLASTLWSAQLLGAYGREDDVSVQEDLVKINHQVPREFPPNVLAEADALPTLPDPADFAGREDVRHLPLVTIDGADARDFDDAVLVEPLPDGGYILRVAVADVSHYVRPRSALDAEALVRGNSWYFPTSVEPMLPKALSNGLCSLNPDVDRLAMLAEIPFSATGKAGKPRFAAVVMRSAARLTYDAVKACMLDHDPEALAALRGLPRGPAVEQALDAAFGLYRILREMRRARGSLDFDLPEPAYSFDAQGRVTAIEKRQRHDAHRLIEEFMIAANEAVARHLRDTGLPFLYRIHPNPEPERLENLLDALEATALERMPAVALTARKGGARPNAGIMQAILASAAGTEQEFLVNRLCLRAMPQARYQPEKEGHFGLASEAYCHFTSPIRRYADLLNHRALKASLGTLSGELLAGQKLMRTADQLNRLERAAMECEREIARRLGCLALQDRIHERFAGVVASVTDFGLFVELQSMPIEGLIRVEDLGDDWFEFDPRTLCLLGQSSGLVLRMGQALEVILAEVNLGRLEIRLLPAALPGSGAHPSGPRFKRGPASQRRSQQGSGAPDRGASGRGRSGRAGMGAGPKTHEGKGHDGAGAGNKSHGNKGRAGTGGNSGSGRGGNTGSSGGGRNSGGRRGR